MKKIRILLIAGLMIISFSQCSNSENNKVNGTADTGTVMPSRDGVFIHITAGYNDPHRVLMPLKMATLMADDKDVLVYLDIHAVELVVKGAEDLNFADFDSFQSYIKQLADKNVGVYACPTCLKIAGHEPGDLIDGVQVAQKDKFFNFTSGRIITLDY